MYYIDKDLREFDNRDDQSEQTDMQKQLLFCMVMTQLMRSSGR